MGKYLHDSVTENMFSLHWYFDFVNGICGMIIISVFIMGWFLFTNKIVCLYYVEMEMVELIWTLGPSLVLFILGIPSLNILYQSEVFHEMPLLTVKIIGHQWYWSYDYSDFKNSEFDSFMLKGDNLKAGFFNFFEVDNRMVVPFDSLIRLILSSSDVIHSWTIPNLGIKVDCIPGKMNQSFFKACYPGVFYGQCSEICGAYHSFMPIVVESTTPISFLNWLKTLNTS